jgi:ribokinase
MSRSTPVVTVVGSFAVGMTLRAPRFPVAGETLIGSGFDMGPGGKGSNQAVGAARLGAQSHIVACIGADLFGDLSTQLYAAEGVHAGRVRRTAERNTGVGFITLDAAGDNQIVLDPGANALLSPADVDAAEALIAASDAVLSVLEIPPATAGRALTLARRHGAIAILNPAPATPLDDSLLSQVDVLTPNSGELRVLLGLPPDDATAPLTLAQRLQAHGVRNVVVTLGGEGALIVAASGVVEHVPGVPVPVVDTTGAGDAFTCALAVALAEGRSLGDAVRFANHAGALACTKLGAITALPRRAELDARLARGAG